MFTENWGKILGCLSLILIILLIIKIITLYRHNIYLKKQIHHRVKNNLQLVSSLLNLQLKYSFDSNVLSELNESKSRFSTLNILNKRLLQEDDIVQEVEITKFIKDIVNQYDTNTIQFESIFDINAGQLKVDIEKIIPLGLLINELILFNIKNGLYQINEKIKITIGGCPIAKHYNFEFVNEHTAANWETKFKDTLSKQIVLRLANQLQTEMKIENSKGMKFSFNF